MRSKFSAFLNGGVFLFSAAFCTVGATGSGKPKTDGKPEITDLLESVRGLKDEARQTNETLRRLSGSIRQQSDRIVRIDRRLNGNSD